MIDYPNRDELLQWYYKTKRRGRTSFPDLYERVAEVLLADSSDANEADCLRLLEEIDGKLTERAGDSLAERLGSPPTDLTDNEYTVLRALRDAQPRRLFLVELGDNTAITRKTCGKLLASLTERGLADYDSKRRRGATITQQGKALLSTEMRAH